MNQVFADNVRALREHRSWTQEQLAEAAQLNLRTVQRAEAAEGASAETVLAIAGAFDVDVALLRFDALELLARHYGIARSELTSELLAAKQKEVAANYTTIALTRVDSSADLKGVADADAMYFDCTARDDDSLDRAAVLKQQLMDLIDIGNRIDATGRRDLEKAAFEVVTQLNRLGLVVSVAVHHHRLKTTVGDAMPWSTLYVIAALQDEAKDFIVIEKKYADEVRVTRADAPRRRDARRQTVDARRGDPEADLHERNPLGEAAKNRRLSIPSSTRSHRWVSVRDVEHSVVRFHAVESKTLSVGDETAMFVLTRATS